MKLRATRNIEKTNNSKTWQFFENLRNFANFFFFNLIVNKFLNFWQLFRKLSNFHNRIFFEFTNLQKFINVLNLQIHRFYKFKIFQYLQNLFIIKNFKNPKNIKWKII